MLYINFIKQLLLTMPVEFSQYDFEKEFDHNPSLKTFKTVYDLARDSKKYLMLKKILLMYNLNVDSVDEYGCSLLMWAAQYALFGTNKVSIKILCKLGANVNLQNNNGLTALMLATRYSNRTSSADVVKYLMLNGANTETKCHKGKTALIYGCANIGMDTSVSAIITLLSHKADPSIVDNKNHSSKHFLNKNGFDIAEFRYFKLYLES